MAVEEVTTGNQLLSYTGNAALAGGPGSEATGYDKIDFSPLERYAVNKFRTNQIDFEQQQEDKKALEAEFYDPTLFQDIDKNLADQLDPDMKEFMSLAKQNLQMDPNSEKYYRAKQLHKELVQKNAKAKVAQAEKDIYEKLAGESKDEHEREKMLEHVEKLKNYKIGDDLPTYTSYIPFDAKHLPVAEEAKGVYKRLSGNSIETVKYTTVNALGLDQKAKLQRLADPRAFSTGEDLGHTLVQHGGLPEINKAAKDTYEKSTRYNIDLLKQKYAPDLTKFQKENPTKTIKEFFESDPVRAAEYKKITDGHQYLLGDPEFKKGIQYIPVEQDHGAMLDNFTYTPDGKFRLNVDNDTLRAIYSATQKPAGRNEEVIETELSKTPAEIEKLKAEIELRKAQTKTQGSIQAKNYAAARKINKQTETITPLPTTIVPSIGNVATLHTIQNKDANGKVTGTSKQFIIASSRLPEDLRIKAGFVPNIPKPEKTGDPDKDAVALQKYNKLRGQAGKGNYQMIFYDANGNDITADYFDFVKAGKRNVDYLLKSAPTDGVTVKFVDANGNVVGTTESIDKQTLIEDLKVRTKGDPELNTDLPAEEF